MKRCSICKEKFEPRFTTLRPVCENPACIIEFAKQNRDKLWKKEKKKMKEKLQTKSDLLRVAQQLFNAFIRNRDKNKGCISCGATLSGKFDAGHFYSVGSYPNLRFNENNVHGQCVHCNQHKGGNLHEYRIRIVERIGEQALFELSETRNEYHKFTKEEIQSIIDKYKK